MRKSRTRTVKKISLQKIFWLISLIFLLGSCIFYGLRFIKLYKENNKKYNIEDNGLVKVIDNNKNDNYKRINDEFYFVNDADNNYLLYSNILFRIIKINDNGEIAIISDNSLTSLAFGQNKDFNNSYINKWLNSNDGDYSGIFYNALNSPDKYLVPSITCLDTFDSLSNADCNDINYDNYITLLSSFDFINVGGKDSYINNGESFYLQNSTSDNKIWYITSDGNSITSNGIDIIGVRPILTIKAGVEYIGGNGTINNPYVIEKKSGLFGSYVKLDNDLWRVYKIKDDEIRLSLNDYLKVNNEDLEYIYSNTSSYHNDTNKKSLAYYLNNDFLDGLSYKDKIKEVKWPNGYYSSQNGYDYVSALNTEINSKVALISIGDIRLNSKLFDYFTMTGTKDKGMMVYIVSQNQKMIYKSITKSMKVVPVISIDKDLLINGDGSINNPYTID